SQMATGMTNTEVRSVAVDPQSSSIVYAATNVANFRSTDGGRSWIAIPDLPYVENFVASDRDPDTVYACGSGLFRSVNKGVTWTQIGSESTYLTNIEIDPDDPAVLYATGAGVSRSVDAGQTWTPLTAPSTQAGSYVRSIAIDPGGSRMLF